MSGELSPDALLNSVLDELPTGVWVAKAPNGELVYANRLFEEILGRRARDDLQIGEHAAGYGLQDRFGRPYRDEALPFSRALRERRTVVADDIVIARPDGARRYIRAQARPLFSKRGEVTHIVVTFNDISAQVKAEAESAAARTRLSMAVDHAPIALFMSDREGVITISEGAGLRGLNFRSGELVGRNVFDIYSAPDVQHNLRRAFSGETFTTITQHGDTVLETWMAPLLEDGTLQGIVGISTDITERQRLLREMAHADRMSAVGRLASSVAHEINNPLTYTGEALRAAREISAALRAQSSAGPSSLFEELEQLLNDASEGAERVRLIASDLKMFARRDEETLRPVSIDAAVQTAAKMVAKRIGARGRVQLDLRSGAEVRADEGRLVQIFVNLILNAADALPQNAPERHRIRVSTQCEGDQVIAEVADSGPGVSAAMREHLFEPFWTTKARGEGTGLGLYVTHAIVLAFGGSIDVETAPEGGALFRIHLPLLAAEREGTPAPSASGARAAPNRACRPRILIIDDEAPVGRLFARALQEQCDVEVIDQGRVALERLLSGARYDLVFCDLMMGDLGGTELYLELAARAPGRERELLFMTGGVFDPKVEAFLDAVPNARIDKPFDIRAEVRKRLAM